MLKKKFLVIIIIILVTTLVIQVAFYTILNQTSRTNPTSISFQYKRSANEDIKSNFNNLKTQNKSDSGIHTKLDFTNVNLISFDNTKEKIQSDSELNKDKTKLDKSIDKTKLDISINNPIDNTKSNFDTTKNNISILQPLVDKTYDPKLVLRREAVKQAFVHTWNGYKKYAWGADELKPLSKTPHNSWGDIGGMILDAIDTMIIMDLKEDVKMAREFIKNVSFIKDYDASTFETTIRFVGGLLSAFSLTGDKLYKEKATELMDRMVPAFKTEKGVPYATVNLKTGHAYSPDWCGYCSFLSEFGSIQLEMRYLSHVTGIKTYDTMASRIMDVFIKDPRYKGLFPTQYNLGQNQFVGTHITFGSRGDSYYEYLLKQYLQDPNQLKIKELYDKAMEDMNQKLVKKSKNKLTYIVEIERDSYIINKMDHLVCFVPGMLALDGDEQHLKLAKEIMYTCYQFYKRSKTGLAPEIAGFDVKQDDDSDFFFQAPHNLLRPETVESLMVMYRVTGDEIYRDWGWEIFQAFEKHTKTEIAFASIENVDSLPVMQRDNLHTFFLAETLKYLYLLFCPEDYVSLDEYVFNTEAHPLRKFNFHS